MANGQARELRPGVWRIAVSTGRGPDGKYHEISRIVHATTKRQVDAALRQLHAEAEERKRNAERYVHGVGATVADLLDKWWEHITCEGRSPNTLNGYKWRLPIIKAAIGTVEVAELRVSDLNNFYRTLGKRYQAASTILQFHRIISAALTWATEEEWVAHNVAANARPPKPARAEIHPPSPADVRRLVAEADGYDPEFGVALRLAAHTGVRRAELCALRWDDVSFANSALMVRASVVVDGGKVAVKAPKSGRFRSVPLSAEMLAALEAHMRGVAGRAQAAGCVLPDNPFLFCTDVRAATPITPDALSNRWEAVRARAGVSCRLHDLRHFFATQLLAAGKDVVRVSYWLGHSSTRMTLDVYGHYIPDSGLGAAAASFMQRLLAPEKEEA
jgi:integrase